MTESSGLELVLVCGDLHIPHRTAKIPDKFREILQPGKMRLGLCTGNVCTEDQLAELNKIVSRVHCTRGDFDEDESLPETEVVTIGDFKIGLCHGHQVVPWGDLEALAMLQRQLGVDILVTGHTHQNSVMEYEGKYYINPGSLTGAFSTLTGESTPSFVLLAVGGSKVITYVYELHGGEMKITKSEFSKAPQR